MKVKPAGSGGRPPIWTLEKIKEEAKLLLQWAQEPDSIVLAEFYGLRGYCYQRVSEFEEICPEFAEAKRNAKLLIGARREKGAITGKYESSIVKKSMALYDPEMRAYEIELKTASKPVLNIHDLPTTIREIEGSNSSPS